MTETPVPAPARPASILDPNLRARVADFLTDCSIAIDEDRLEDWPGFFTDDALYHITTRENEARGLPVGIMHCRGRGMLEDRVKALRIANIFEPHSYCHILGPVRLVDAGGGLVSARTSFSVIRTMQNGESMLFAAGRFLDEIAVDASTLAIRSRRVVLESRRVDILLVIPL